VKNAGFELFGGANASWQRIRRITAGCGRMMPWRVVGSSSSSSGQHHLSVASRLRDVNPADASRVMV